MSLNTTHYRRAPKSGVDTLLTVRGKRLASGQSVRFRLVKGPSVETSGDPVDSKAPPQYFPMIAKFGESVVRPDFSAEPWRSARMYEQEVPKPVDDSDEEGEGGEGDGAAASSQQPKKKRWRYGDGEAARQWILQENVDFLQTMVDRKEQRTTSSSANKKTTSTRYEGTAEHNPSHYGLIRLLNPGDEETLQVCLLPSPQNTNCIINFAQPSARKSYSLTEAEHVISDQRMGLVKTLHHIEPSNPNLTSANSGDQGDSKGEDGGTGEAAPPPRPLNILALRRKAAQSSKGRLLSRLQQKSKAASAENEEEEGDDIMGDVAFRNRKGGGVARKELLSSVADSVLVSDEGVLGGSNDVMFGGRQRFAQFQEAQDSKQDEGGEGAAEEDRAGEATQQRNKERGGDGAAMDDDFYQRDVKAEYDELDYDANEQFDDDDVDLGEAEQVIESAGFKEDDADDEVDDDEDDDVDLQDGGAEGLASLAGFKALLAKARGETPPEGEAPSVTNKQRIVENESKRKREVVDHMSKIIAADEKAKLDASRKAAQQGGLSMDTSSSANHDNLLDKDTAVPSTEDSTAVAPNASRASDNNETARLDANGLRIISLEAVRREIWLNHGSIPMKRLMKIFDVKKKSTQDRQDKFREVVKELCTMTMDPVNGRMLVLKQHYSKV